MKEEISLENCITKDFLDRCRAAWESDESGHQAARAITKNGPLLGVMDVDVPRRLPFTFSVDVWDEGVTDQGESLRCWAFASLNVVRQSISENLNLAEKNFELSQNFTYFYDQLEKTGTPGAEEIRVENLTVQDNRGLTAVDGLSLSVRAGEILGIAAIEGNGQSELLEAITGMRRVERGTVEVCGQNVTGKTAGEIRKVGLSHIPEDRLATGVSRSASVTDNLLMGKQRDKAFSGFAFHQRRSSIERYAEEVYERFDIRGAGIDTAVGSMSGGNMQKVVVAREFSFDSPVLIIAQPTRGVDVGAIEFIHTRIIEKRNAGCAILLCSADLDEVFRLSDRIITMYEGRITGEFRASDITKEEIGWYMTGHREGKEAAKA